MEDTEECAPVTVEGSWTPAQAKTLKNKLQLYFQSKKKSGGGECRVEAEDGAPRAKVFFSSAEVRERVLARQNHEIVLDNQTVKLRLSSGASSKNVSEVPDSSADVKTPEPEVKPKVSASKENEDEENEESPQGVSVVLDNIGDMSREMLLMLLENISGLDDSHYSLEIIYESNRAVVTFSNPTDGEGFLSVGQSSQKLQKLKLSARPLEAATSVRVERLPPTVIDDMLGLYFDTNWTPPENIVMIPDEEAAIVTFKDPKVVKSICIKEDYSIVSIPVKVYPYFESLSSALYGKERPSWKMPKPFKETVSPIIWKYLQEKKLLKSINDHMHKYYCSVNMDMPQAELTPLPNFLRQKGLTAQQVDAWESSARDAFRQHMSQYTAFECPANELAWNAAEAESPKDGSEISEPLQSVSVVLDNIGDMSREMLLMLLENISGLDDSHYSLEIIYESNRAVVTFSNPTDGERFLSVGQSSQKLQKLKLSARQLEAATSVRVERLPPTVIDAMLVVFFGVKWTPPENIVMIPDEEAAIVTFKDPQVVKSICIKEDYSIVPSIPVKVYPYFESLSSALYGKERPSLKMPKPFTETVSPIIWKYLQEKKLLKSINDHMRQYFCSVNMDTPQAELTPFPNFLRQKGLTAQQVDAWESSARVAFRKHMSQYTAFECSANELAWKAAEAESPKDGSEISEPLQSVSVVLDNIGDMSREMLLMLLENISGLDDSHYSLEIIYESNRAVVTFSNPTDGERFLSVGQSSPKLQKHKLSARQLEAATSVRVERLPSNVIDDMLELYFDKNWTQPENIVMIPEEEAAIVTFKDPKVVTSICIKEDYSIVSIPVKVYPYFESLSSALYGKERPSWKMPKPFTETVSPIIWKYLQEKKLTQSINDHMRQYFCSVNMDAPQAELTPLPNFLRQKGLTAQQVDAWESSARDAFRQHMSQYTAFECPANELAWKAAEAEVHSIIGGNVFLDFDGSRGVLTVAGRADDIKRIRAPVESIVLKAISQIERQKNGISDLKEVLTVMDVDVEDKLVLNLQRWNDQKQQLLDSCKSKKMKTVSIQDYPGSEDKITVAGFRNPVNEVGRSLMEFMRNDSRTKESIHVKSVVVQFIERKKSLEWSSIAKDNEVKVNLDPVKQRIFIEGAHHHVQKAKSCFKNLTSSLFCDHLSVNKPGAKKFFQSQEYWFQSILMSDFGCVVMLRPENQEEEEEENFEENNGVSYCKVRTAAGVHVSVSKADICTFGVDVVVNSANEDLQHIGGLSLAMLKEAGPQLQRISDNYVSKNGKLRPGDAILTDSCNLQCKYIVHAVGPRFSDTDRKTAVLHLKLAVTQSLKQAERKECTSIALPAIGSGALGLPVDLCAETIAQAVREYCDSPGSVRSLKEIHLVDNNDNTVRILAAAVNKEFSDLGPTMMVPSQAGGKSPKAAGGYHQGRGRGGERQSPWNHVVTSFFLPGGQRRSPANLVLETEQFEPTVFELCADNERAVSQAKKKIEELILKEQAKKVIKDQYISQLSQGDMDELKDLQRNLTVSITLDRGQQGQEPTICLEGLTRDVLTAEVSIRPIFQRVERQVNWRNTAKEDNSSPLPQHWDDMKGDLLKLIPLNPGDKEYSDVQILLTQTGLRTTIIKIERVQNPTLWQSYQLKKQQLEKKNKHKNNERRLFHGTKADCIDLINQHGFNRSYSGKHAAMYGNGSYFAVDPCYSAKGYATPDPSGYKHMYLARVLVGDFTRGASGMITPPAKNSGHVSDLYDSVTDNTANPTMFIVFNDMHAYPEYLITFT